MAELCSAVRNALDDERCTAEESLRRAAEILQEMGEAAVAVRSRLGAFEHARQSLAAVYNRFTEGYGTADLEAAKELLVAIPSK